MPSPCRTSAFWIRVLVPMGLVVGVTVPLPAQLPNWRPPSRTVPGTSALLHQHPEHEPAPGQEPVHAGPPIHERLWQPPLVPAAEEIFFLEEDLGDRCFGERIFCQPVYDVPNMLGDVFGTGTERLFISGNELLTASPTEVFDPADLGAGPTNSFEVIGPGNSVAGRQKAADNNSPLPRNRVFFNYNYVANAILQDGGASLHRFTPGFERTFLSNMASLEVRVPTAITFDSDSNLTGGSSRDQAELGNLYLALKGLVWSSEEIAISAGLGTSMPTADSLRFFNPNGRELLRVENRSFHLLPYLAGAWSDGGFFFQGFLQGDVDVNGNPVSIDNGTGLRRVGDFEDSSSLYLDLGAGYWLFRDHEGGLINGLAPTVELHYNVALTSADVLDSPSGIVLGEEDRRPELVNLVVGATFQLRSRNTLALGWTKSVGGDEQIDDGLHVLLNWYFGRR